MAEVIGIGVSSEELERRWRRDCGDEMAEEIILVSSRIRHMGRNPEAAQYLSPADAEMICNGVTCHYLFGNSSLCGADYLSKVEDKSRCKSASFILKCPSLIELARKDNIAKNFYNGLKAIEQRRSEGVS